MLQMLHIAEKGVNVNSDNAKQTLISVSKIEDGLANFGDNGNISIGPEQQVEKFQNLEG